MFAHGASVQFGQKQVPRRPKGGLCRDDRDGESRWASVNVRSKPAPFAEKKKREECGTRKSEAFSAEGLATRHEGRGEEDELPNKNTLGARSD